MNNTANVVKAIDDLPDETGGRCRDCADDGPFCPNRGMPCTISVADLRSLAAELRAANAVIDHYANEDNWRPPDYCSSGYHRRTNKKPHYLGEGPRSAYDEPRNGYDKARQHRELYPAALEKARELEEGKGE